MKFSRLVSKFYFFEKILNRLYLFIYNFINGLGLYLMVFNFIKEINYYILFCVGVVMGY